MKYLIVLLFPLLCFSQEKKEEVRTKKVDGVTYHLKDSKEFKKDGKFYTNTYWLEGNVKDTNKDGKIENATYICELKEKKEIIFI